jgi:hypothetical protein
MFTTIMVNGAEDDSGMNLHSQLALGDFGDTLVGILWHIVLLAPFPLLIWLVVSLIMLFRKRAKSMKWWGIIVVVFCVYGCIVFGYLKVFKGAPYMIAQRIHVYVPMNVEVLENDQKGSRDEVEEYEVIRFNHRQMDEFITSIRLMGWKNGTVVPDSLRHPNPNDFPDPMSDRTYPLPRRKRSGYYFSLIKKRYGAGDWYTTRMAYFLDVKTRLLYVYYDDAQWG